MDILFFLTKAASAPCWRRWCSIATRPKRRTQRLDFLPDPRDTAGRPDVRSATLKAATQALLGYLLTAVEEVAERRLPPSDVRLGANRAVGARRSFAQSRAGALPGTIPLGQSSGAPRLHPRARAPVQGNNRLFSRNMF